MRFSTSATSSKTSRITSTASLTSSMTSLCPFPQCRRVTARPSSCCPASRSLAPPSGTRRRTPRSSVLSLPQNTKRCRRRMPRARPASYPGRPKSNALANRRPLRKAPAPNRSEEHTSELQSRLHLVCRLLLEKTAEHPAQPLQPAGILQPDDDPQDDLEGDAAHPGEALERLTDLPARRFQLGYGCAGGFTTAH